MRAKQKETIAAPSRACSQAMADRSLGHAQAQRALVGACDQTDGGSSLACGQAIAAPSRACSQAMADRSLGHAQAQHALVGACGQAIGGSSLACGQAIAAPSRACGHSMSALGTEHDATQPASSWVCRRKKPVPCLTRRQMLGACAGSCLLAFGMLTGCSVKSSRADVSAEVHSTSDLQGDAVSSSVSPTDSAQASEQGKEFEQISSSVFAFDTVVTLKASCSQGTMDALVERCRYFESIFSRTIEESDIGRINAAGGVPVEVMSETADIISKALGYCEQSNGRFDITIGAVSSLWDFKEGVVPDPGSLAEAARHVDYRKVQVEGKTVTLLDPLAKLDLGGIAKGYIADDLCARLVEAGCTSGFVNLGGNVKTIGLKPDGKPWHVGIQDPNDAHDVSMAAVYADEQGTSVVTSGLYERQFTRDGQRYWHILDPKTGYPVETDLISATIVSSSSIDGDGYTKPLFMMGHDEALAWIEESEGIEGLVMDAGGAITQSSGCNAELFS